MKLQITFLCLLLFLIGGCANTPVFYNQVNYTTVETQILNNSVWTKNQSTIYYKSGNVGIGTDTPRDGLEINTTTLINNDSYFTFDWSADDSKLRVGSDSGGSDGLFTIYDPSISNAKLLQYGGGSLNVMLTYDIIGRSGSFPLGTSITGGTTFRLEPDTGTGTFTKITTTGGTFTAADNYGYTLENSVSTSRYGLKYGTAGNLGDTNTLIMLSNREVDGELAFATDDGAGSGGGETERMRLTGGSTGGNLGIGTQTPQAHLDVDGIRSTDVGLIVSGASGQSADLTQWQDSTGTVLNVVDASGNIGVGTSTPNTSLDVNGDVDIKGSLTIDNDCGMQGMSESFERGTVVSNAAWSLGNGQTPRGVIMACDGQVVALGATCTGTLGTSLSARIRVNGVVNSACDTNIVNVSGTTTVTSCNIPFSKGDTVGVYAGTEVGAWTECVGTMFATFD